MQRLCLSMNVLYPLIVIPILGHWLGVLVAKGMGWPLSEIAGYTIVPTLSVIVIAIGGGVAKLKANKPQYTQTTTEPPTQLNHATSASNQ